ncbi:MAG: T9SS type A sorting domain-containing protein [Rhodothermaceae bacterium]|nr:T9SS type A sorting domain-containing protein [Rhodothermaceae bacterium]
MKKLSTSFACLLCAVMLMPAIALAQQPTFMQQTRSNTSQSLRSMSVPTGTSDFIAPFAVPNKLMRFESMKNAAVTLNSGTTDPVLQTQDGNRTLTVLENFDGSSDADNAAVLGFRLVPPDTQGDVGPNHYVQWINSVSEIFDKNGNTIMGPFPGNLYFAGLGGICENTNNGDPIVLYDEGADRFLVSQFALDFAANNFAMCIAISTTPDPTGSYHQYELNFGTIFPDYPKLGIWGDSYTMTTRNFGDPTGFNQSAIAMDRHAMLNGDPLQAVSFRLPRFFFEDGLLPMDSDSPNISGPALFGGHTAFGVAKGDRNQVFRLYALDVDWNNPGAASLTTLPSIDIPDYEIKGPAYVIQPNGESLADLETFTMHRAQVRDFGTHRSMVANHTVVAKADAAGVRWYEMRDYGSGWSLYQAGTYSPKNANDRWMASIAMNGNGDIGLGYSLTGSSENPSIYVTGQTASASGSGVMNVRETLVVAGGGSQEGSANRWGDYSMMSVDPSDDETFWYTQEYYASTGSFDFSTRIASFDLDGSGANKANLANEDAQIQSDVPTEFALDQNYPNPFNPTTMINFNMPESGHVTVRVVNVLGQEVARVVDGVMDAGTHSVSFDATSLTAGVYLYVMESGQFTETRRMTLLK